MSTTLTTSKTAAPSDRLKINGELVVYVDGMPDFGALQSRETAQRTATYMAFDVLAANGSDIRKLPWSKRRKNLETLASTWVY
ncbi:hypothetical protein OG394_00715 [Kribbella sp. NBC_01245]|uniref:hypothetical protein n=1 Tax=Kribbella sp. NBC_01245 TaxID=2903578 RepID=UPI002E2A4EF2|nr:hypothetical protein [Kribbella sp. NBC_01245]